MVEVECYSGYKADERPISFTIHGHKFQIKEILDRWYGQDYEYFKVTADDGNDYILKHHRNDDSWSLEYTDTKL